MQLQENGMTDSQDESQGDAFHEVHTPTMAKTTSPPSDHAQVRPEGISKDPCDYCYLSICLHTQKQKWKPTVVCLERG